MLLKLGPDKAHIFRITHVSNLPWILDNGLHCMSSVTSDPNFVPIGMAPLIQKRSTHPVAVGPGGFLSDYVPFYFTPSSVMLFNIKTGHNDVIQRPNKEIVILVSSLPRLVQMNIPFVFADAHANLAETTYFDDLAGLHKIDWHLLCNRDFKRDPDDPGKMGRYQAEALVYRHVPVDALLGVACYDDTVARQVDEWIRARGLPLKIRVTPNWYF